MDSDAKALAVIAEQEQAAQARGEWDATCEQICQRILPRYANQFANRALGLQTTQFRNTHEMVDSTGALALKRFAAAMESMNTPHTATWHSVLPSDPVLKRNRDVRLYFEEVTRLLFTHRYAPTSNFASQKYIDYMMSGAVGNAILFVDALQNKYERGLRYRGIHPGQCWFRENHQGQVDTVYRRFDLTARQAVQQFGPDRLPDIIKADAAEGKRAERKHWFVHKVSPNAEYDRDRKDLAGMRYASCYVSVTEKVTVRESGYHTFPYAVSRYSTLPGQVMGDSIAMMALPTIKSLNEMKRTALKQGQRTVDPVLLAHDDGILDTFSLRAGAINPGGVNADGKPLVHVLPTGNLAVSEKMMDAEQAVINDFFLVSLFRILVDSPQKTATQVIEETREKGMLLTPEMRQMSESLGPMIDREIDVLTQLHLLPPMPQMLLDAQGDYTVLYDNPMTRMARANEASGFMRMIDFSTSVFNVTQNPELFDDYNFDVAIPALADIHAVPVSWLNSAQKKQQMRDQRAQQAQEQQMVDALPAATGAMKTMMPPPQPMGTA